MQVYLASGAIYHEDVFMPDFLDMFPNTVRKVSFSLQPWFRFAKLSFAA